MSEVDLNLSNYSLNDIIKLFKLDYELNEEGMKKAKRQVLMMHPDKSNLKKEYFLFFSSAYKLLYKVYDFQKRNTQDTTIKRNYSSVDIDEDREHNEAWMKLSKHKNFNKIFNELFDEIIVNDNKNDGYGDWLKQQEEYLQAKNIDEMNTVIAERKKNLSSVVVFNGIQDNTGNIGTSLTEEDHTDYQAGLFSILQYDDLKHAYTETVVPVTEEEYEKRTKYSGVDHLQRTRQYELHEAVINSNHDKTLRDERVKEYSNDMERVYCLMKQDEKHKQQTNKLASKLLQIAN